MIMILMVSIMMIMMTMMIILTIMIIFTMMMIFTARNCGAVGRKPCEGSKATIATLTTALLK